jgi:uncharacterized protein (TIGR00661 family)
MRILYGVVGEGMGHATRSRVVLEHLLQAEHEVRVVVSGRAHRFLVECLGAYPNATVDEIQGLKLSYFGNRLDKSDSLFVNLRDAPAALLRNLRVYRKVAEDGFHPELVISDFESWAAIYAINHFLPVVSIDNLQMIARCRHPDSVTRGRAFDFSLAKCAVRIKMPGAAHYLITSFFFPPVAKRRTTLLPPILRPEIMAARREPGDHVLVYQTSSSNQRLVPALQKLPYTFRVYGMGREGVEGNVVLCPFSEHSFFEDLRTARAVIAGGGFTVLSEAVSLRVPVLSIPIERQYEQELNARYVEHLGYGVWSRTLELEVVEQFLRRLDEFSHALSRYQRCDNSLLFGCVDELIRRVSAGEKKIDCLESQAPGKWEADAP